MAMTGSMQMMFRDLIYVDRAVKTELNVTSTVT